MTEPSQQQTHEHKKYPPRQMKTCPRCGAEIQKPTPPKCSYCGTALRAEPIPGAPQTARRVPATPTLQPPENLPPEYSHLKRPEPSTPLESTGCLLIFGLVWTGFSMFLFLALLNGFVRDYFEYFQLAQQGVITQATVTWLETHEGDDSTSYYVYYEYMGTINHEAGIIEDSDRISSSLYDALKIEQQIEILYVPTNAAISAVRTEFAPPNPIGLLLMVGIGGVFILVGLGVLYAGGKAQKEQKEKQAFAQSLGFAPYPVDEKLTLKISRLYQRPGAKNQFQLRNVFHKPLLDGDMYWFDLVNTSGEDDSWTERQAVAICSSSLKLPAFMLYPKADPKYALSGLANKVLEWGVSFVGNPVAFPEYPALNAISTLTPEGERQAAAWNSFQTHLQQVTRRHVPATPDLFERYLPYAAGFGMQSGANPSKKWKTCLSRPGLKGYRAVSMMAVLRRSLL
jgi:hypothetical protein